MEKEQIINKLKQAHINSDLVTLTYALHGSDQNSSTCYIKQDANGVFFEIDSSDEKVEADKKIDIGRLISVFKIFKSPVVKKIDNNDVLGIGKWVQQQEGIKSNLKITLFEESYITNESTVIPAKDFVIIGKEAIRNLRDLCNEVLEN